MDVRKSHHARHRCVSSPTGSVRPPKEARGDPPRAARLRSWYAGPTTWMEERDRVRRGHPKRGVALPVALLHMGGQEVRVLFDHGTLGRLRDHLSGQKTDSLEALHWHR